MDIKGPDQIFDVDSLKKIRLKKKPVQWIIAIVVAGNRDNLAQLHVRLTLALLLINLGGYVAGTLGSRLMRLPEPMRRALTLEIGMQNAGLGTILAASVTKSEIAEIAPAMYTFGCMFTGIIVARLWAEFGPRGAGEQSDGDAPAAT